MSNNYSAPSADLVKNADHGDALAAGIAGDYDFKIGDVISEAWSKTKGIKRYVLGAGILMYVILFAIIMVLSTVMVLSGSGVEGENPFGNSAIFQLVFQLVFTAIFIPFFAGIFILCMKHVAGASVGFGDVFSCYSKTAPLFVTAILMNIMIMLGLLLFILPGIYLGVAYGLAIPLVADRDMSPWQALEASRKAITKRWFSVFGMWILLTIIVFVSALPLGIGLIWTMPMMAVAIAILYRNVFGIASY